MVPPSASITSVWVLSFRIRPSILVAMVLTRRTIANRSRPVESKKGRQAVRSGERCEGGERRQKRQGRRRSVGKTRKGATDEALERFKAASKRFQSKIGEGSLPVLVWG